MTKHTKSSPITNRRGFSVIELIVAATLLITMLGVVAPLVVRSGQLWQESRHYQLALDELANQLEVLTSLDSSALKTALAELSPSQTLRDALSNPVLSADTIADADGRRLVLSLQWDRVGHPRPLTLIAWLEPPAATPSGTGSFLRSPRSKNVPVPLEQKEHQP